MSNNKQVLNKSVKKNRGKPMLTLDEFVRRSRAVHGDRYDYSKVVYTGRKHKVEIVCPEHGSFWMSPDNHWKGQGCSHPGCSEVKKKATNRARYGVDNPMQVEGIKNRQVQSLLNNHGVRNPMQIEEVKQRQRASQAETMLERYGQDSVGAVESLRQRAEAANVARYGVKNVMKLREFQIKMMNSKLLNGTTSTSESEEALYDILCELYGNENVKRQYSDPVRYSYACDFYIEPLDLFIEFNGCWSHGEKWYDAERDIEEYKRVKERADNGESFFKTWFYVWTKLDVKKRNLARSQNLNYLTFWDNKLRDVKLWISEGCPIGNDGIREYSWLEDRQFGSDIVLMPDNITESSQNLSLIVKHYQAPVFYRNEIQMWRENISKDHCSLQVKLYYNRLQYLEKNPSSLTDFEILKGFTLSGIYKGHTVFDTALMGEVFDIYGIRSVYDPCAGWGERMLFCKYRDIEYLGIDVNDELRDGYERMMSDLDITKQEIVFADSATVKVNKTCDCVFTCPPYGNQEIYSEYGAENLEHDEFLNWWRQVVENSLQVGPRYFMFQINQRWLDEMSQVVESRGFKKISQLDGKIKASHMNKNTKKEFESVLVFEKSNGNGGCLL